MAYVIDTSTLTSCQIIDLAARVGLGPLSTGGNDNHYIEVEIDGEIYNLDTTGADAMIGFTPVTDPNNCRIIGTRTDMVGDFIIYPLDDTTPTTQSGPTVPEPPPVLIPVDPDAFGSKTRKDQIDELLKNTGALSRDLAMKVPPIVTSVASDLKWVRNPTSPGTWYDGKKWHSHPVDVGEDGFFVDVLHPKKFIGTWFYGGHNDLGSELMQENCLYWYRSVSGYDESWKAMLIVQSPFLAGFVDFAIAPWQAACYRHIDIEMSAYDLSGQKVAMAIPNHQAIQDDTSYYRDLYWNKMWMFCNTYNMSGGGMINGVSYSLTDENFLHAAIPLRKEVTIKQFYADGGDIVRIDDGFVPMGSPPIIDQGVFGQSTFITYSNATFRVIGYGADADQFFIDHFGDVVQGFSGTLEFKNEISQVMHVMYDPTAANDGAYFVPEYEANTGTFLRFKLLTTIAQCMEPIRLGNNNWGWSTQDASYTTGTPSWCVGGQSITLYTQGQNHDVADSLGFWGARHQEPEFLDGSAYVAANTWVSTVPYVFQALVVWNDLPSNALVARPTDPQFPIGQVVGREDLSPAGEGNVAGPGGVQKWGKFICPQSVRISMNPLKEYDAVCFEAITLKNPIVNPYNPNNVDATTTGGHMYDRIDIKPTGTWARNFRPTGVLITWSENGFGGIQYESLTDTELPFGATIGRMFVPGTTFNGYVANSNSLPVDGTSENTLLGVTNNTGQLTLDSSVTLSSIIVPPGITIGSGCGLKDVVADRPFSHALSDSPTQYDGEYTVAAFSNAMLPFGVTISGLQHPKSQTNVTLTATDIYVGFGATITTDGVLFPYGVELTDILIPFGTTFTKTMYIDGDEYTAGTLINANSDAFPMDTIQLIDINNKAIFSVHGVDSGELITFTRPTADIARLVMYKDGIGIDADPFYCYSIIFKTVVTAAQVAEFNKNHATDLGLIVVDNGTVVDPNIIIPVA